MDRLQFSRKEMTAIIALAKAMALADGTINEDEIAMMTKEALRFGIPLDDLMNLLNDSCSIELEDTLSIIAEMNDAQKYYVSACLGMMMAVEGDIDDSEMALWNFVSLICKLPKMDVIEAIAYMQSDIDDFLRNLLLGDNNPSEGSFVFHSNTHQRYEYGSPVRGEQIGCNRDIVIEKNISDDIGYSITVKNPDATGGWGAIPMGTKPMKVISKSEGKVKLRGFGYDKFAYEILGVPMTDATFENYGMTIYHNEFQIIHCVLHMIERKVDIDYYVK
jgi:hypothetical protein